MFFYTQGVNNFVVNKQQICDLKKDKANFSTDFL